MLELPDLLGDYRCPDCGEEAVCHQSTFFEEFGHPYSTRFHGGRMLAAVVSESGDFYSPKTIYGYEDLTHMVLPLGGEWEYTELWDDPDFQLLQEQIEDHAYDAVCSWCYSMHDMDTIIRRKANR